MLTSRRWERRWERRRSPTPAAPLTSPRPGQITMVARRGPARWPPTPAPAQRPPTPGPDRRRSNAGDQLVGHGARRHRHLAQPGRSADPGGRSTPRSVEPAQGQAARRVPGSRRGGDRRGRWAALLDVATRLLKLSTAPVRRRAVADELIRAFDRVHVEHGVTAREFCAALALPERVTARPYRRTASPATAPATPARRRRRSPDSCSAGGSRTRPRLQHRRNRDVR